jgi:anti-sigma regulatory factor (Ser/Thr protein kinase)
MAELSARLLESVHAFAAGAPQEDDVTMVLVKRSAPASVHRSFKRSFESLQGIFDFTSEVFARERIDRGLLAAVDFTLEELFTNMVKYSTTSDAAVRVDIATIDRGVEVALTDYDVEPFDVTQAPDADITLPIEKRKPGGLGLHLIRRLVDSVAYEYSKEERRSRITFRKTTAGATDAAAVNKRGEDARN